jgi:Icc-related predicted phosphoesterase
MRILACADIHGNWRTYDWLLDMARLQRVDAIVLAGDLLGYPDGFETPENAQREDATKLAARLTACAIPVLFIMGNDDLIDLPAGAPGVQSIHDRSLQCGPYSFVGYQFSLPFMGGTYEKSEEAINQDLEHLSRLINPTTVFITHSPAFGFLDPGVNSEHIGSRSIADLLAARQWHAHIHGHSHEGFGRDGAHFNVAAGGRQRAMIIDLDTLTHEMIRADGTADHSSFGRSRGRPLGL